VSPDPRDLSDERSLRLALEERLSKEVDRTAQWRARAEERMSRIRDLEERLERARKLPGPLAMVKDLLRAPRQSTTTESPPSPPSSPRPRLPTVTVAAISAHPAVRPVVEEATVLDPTTDKAAIARADMVVIDTPGWTHLDEETRRAILDEVERDGAPPLVVWTEGFPSTELARAAHSVVTLRPGEDVGFLPGSYTRRPPTSGGPPLPASAADLNAPTSELIAAAASGRPLSLGLESETESDVRSHRSLRWAHRHHRPSRRLSELLTLVGVPHPDPTPHVAAVLVSNRPDRVRDALSALGAQTWRPLEVVVGLHGFDDPDLAPPTPDMELSVIRFDAGLTLGECLNRAVESTTAGVIAKIDDDDHYGPAYLEDSIRDLDSTYAQIVGKATVYTYLADDNTTVLRRPGTEHRMVSGTFGGNTLVMERAVWEAVPFPHRPRFVDTILLEAARRQGFDLYSGSRFEFCAERHGAGHTYGGSDALMAAGSAQAWHGLHPDRTYVVDLEKVRG